MVRRLSRRMFFAGAALAAAACGAASQRDDLPHTLEVAASGDEPGDGVALPSLAAHQRRASLMADVARLARLDATTSLRNSPLGNALIRSIDGIGLDAERRQFLASGRGLPSVSVRVDGGFVLASGMIYSAIDVVQGPLRQAQVSDDGTLQGADYGGAVVLIARGVTPFRVIGRLLEQAGAVGVIVSNNRPGLLYGTLSQPSSIPVVAVTQETGEDLVELLQASEPRAVIDVSPPPRSFEGANVIGHRAGPLRRQVIVATPADAPLADYSHGGNADGLALLLALARYAEDLQPRHSVSFVAFDGTHRGYVGSRWFLAHLSEAERESIDAVFTFDRPGRSQTLHLGSSQGLRPKLDQRLEAEHHDLRVSPDFGVGRGDHDTFATRGIPYAFLASDGGGEVVGDALLQAFQVAAVALEVLDGVDAAATQTN